MRNQFEHVAPKFDPQKFAFKEKEVFDAFAIPTDSKPAKNTFLKPFEAKKTVANFAQSPALREVEAIKQKALTKEAAEKAKQIARLERIENMTPLEWTWLFLELDKEMQDDILVENSLIVPDSIRDDLEAMTKFFKDHEINVRKLVPIEAVL